MTAITVFDRPGQAVLEAFKEALYYKELSYSIEALRRYGFENDAQLSEALGRVIRICKRLGLDTKKHFRYYYKVDITKKQVTRQWKASKLGFYLVLCNGHSSNPFVGAIQIEMLTDILDRLE